LLPCDKFLVFNDYQILKDLGVRSKQQTDQKASSTYDEFNKTQKINKFVNVLRILHITLVYSIRVMNINIFL
jgi:hypothetical protein